MIKFDKKHLAFHTLLALYFIWLPLVLAVIILIAYYEFALENTTFVTTLMPTLFINLIIGASLMYTLRLLNIKPKPICFVRISYYVIVFCGVILGILTYVF